MEKLMLVFIFFHIYFIYQHSDYIQSEVRHSMKVQYVSHLCDPVWFFVSQFLASSFAKAVLCKYLNNCVSTLILKGNRCSSTNTFKLIVFFLTPSICLQSERWNFYILFKLFWYLGSSAFAIIKYKWFNECINKA